MKNPQGLLVALALGFATACSDAEDDDESSGAGGSSPAAGGSSPATAGGSAMGGKGGDTGGTGGENATGGGSATGGSTATGGKSGTGGSTTTGGATASGGATGGTASGGAATVGCPDGATPPEGDCTDWSNANDPEVCTYGETQCFCQTGQQGASWSCGTCPETVANDAVCAVTDMMCGDCVCVPSWLPGGQRQWSFDCDGP